jgi:FkbM family methyltransferase
MYRRRVKETLEALTGYTVMNIGGPNVFVLAAKRSLGRVWFSYDIHLKTLLDRCGVNVVLDVGANRGQFVVRLRRFYKGKVLSFEPVPQIFADLATAAAPDPQWDVYKLALGSRDTTERFNISASSEFSSFLETNEYCQQRFGVHAAAAREELVSVRRLDGLLEDIVPHLDNAKVFLKLDTQGYDIEVFKGLGDKHKHVVALQTEVSLIPVYSEMPHWTESISFFEKAGFGVTGLFPVNREALRVIEYDCVMVNLELQKSGMSQ